MPILDINNDYDSDKSQIVKDKPLRTQEELKTSILYNKEHDLKTIIRYPKGSKWEVNYFLQIRDINDTLSPPDINLPPTVQKYNRINKLILYIQTPIEQDTIEDISGEGLINAGFLPNVNDVFIATLTGGREAIFIITEVTNRTYNLHYAYKISFKIFCFAEDNPNIYNDIVIKVMKNYTYDKDHLLDYSAPIILSSDYKAKLDLRNSLEDVIDYYFRYFVNYEKNVIALKTSASIYVDTLLTDFIFKVINQSDNLIMNKLNYVAIDFRDKIPYTIWDVIINRNTKLLKLCTKNLGFKYSPSGCGDIIQRNMHYIGINFIVDKLSSVGSELDIPIVDISTEKTSDFRPPINKDRQSYVVSEDVYELSNNCVGLLDKVLIDYLECKLLKSEELEVLINQYTMWDTREQFYLIPILIVLIKDAINNTFQSL